MTRVDTLVVGAGVCGLAHALWRRREGRSVHVVEAGSRAGGVIETVHEDGFRMEWAATSVRAGSGNIAVLLASLASPPPLRDAEAAGVQYLMTKSGLRRLPRSPKALLSCSMLSMGQRLRAMVEPFMPRKRLGATARPETLAGFVKRRFGRGIAENFLRPFTAGVYGASPERLGAADAFPTLTALEQRYGSVLKGMMRKAKASGKRGGGGVSLFAGGMERFTDALADELGDALELDAAVSSLAPGRVTLADGREIEAGEIVLAIPARAQAALLRPLAPAAADRLDAVPYVAIGVAGVGFRREDGPAIPDAFGFLRGRGAKLRILGATFASRLSDEVAPEGHELLSVYFGGSEDPAFVAESDDAIRTQILRDLETAFGARIRPQLFRVHRHPRAIPLFAPGHRGRMAAVQRDLTPLGIRLSGSHITGVSLDQCCAPLTPLRGELPHGVTRS